MHNIVRNGGKLRPHKGPSETIYLDDEIDERLTASTPQGSV